MARTSYTTRTKPATTNYIRYSSDGTRHVFTSEAEAVWFTQHTEQYRAEQEAAGSFAALVCNSAWRMSREL
jgi:hypothetical protein